MPHYYFNTVDGHADMDSVGKDLPDDSAARDFAISYAGSILKDQPEIAAASKGFRVNVVDETDRAVLTVLTRVIEGVQDAGTA